MDKLKPCPTPQELATAKENLLAAVASTQNYPLAMQLEEYLSILDRVNESALRPSPWRTDMENAKKHNGSIIVAIIDEDGNLIEEKLLSAIHHAPQNGWGRLDAYTHWQPITPPEGEMV